MTFNNFDESSSGTNITIHVSMDNMLGQIYYDEFREKSLELINSRHEVLGYVVGDTNKIMWTYSQLKAMKKQELYDLACEICGIYYDIDVYTKQELIDDYLANTSIEQYYKAMGIKDIKHASVTSRGYSQGDSVVIIDCEKKITENIESTYYDYILWNHPIYGEFGIDDQTFYYQEICQDSYEWDKNIVIEYIKKMDIQNKEYVIEYFQENLPNTPY